MRKVRKARLLGHDLIEPQICLLYYVWAKCDSTSYCNLEDSHTCYANPEYGTHRYNLEATEYLEANPSDNTFIRLSEKGRKLIFDLGM